MLAFFQIILFLLKKKKRSEIKELHYVLQIRHPMDTSISNQIFSDNHRVTSDYLKRDPGLHWLDQSLHKKQVYN